MKHVLLFCLVTMFTSAAMADSWPNPCEDKESKNTAEGELACSQYNFSMTEAKRRNVYDLVIQALANRPGEQSAYEAAEDAWLEYRERQCESAHAGMRAGTYYSIQVINCKEEMTDERVLYHRESLRNLP